MSCDALAEADDAHDRRVLCSKDSDESVPIHTAREDGGASSSRTSTSFSILAYRLRSYAADSKSGALYGNGVSEYVG